MLLSYVVPCHSRLADLIESLPSVIAAANASPPVELVVVDYGGPRLIEPTLDLRGLLLPSHATFVLYRAREHFHCTHARNLGIRASHGDYVMNGSADVSLRPLCFQHIRALIDARHPAWLCPSQHQLGLTIMRRDEAIACGGYDERFEFYGPDDRDLALRLERRNGPAVLFPYAKTVRVRKTPLRQQIAGYRLPLSKEDMFARTRPIVFENIERGVLVANEGREWGALRGPSWEPEP